MSHLLVSKKLQRPIYNMALRNAFQDLATEQTLNNFKIDNITLDRELLTEILYELKVMNLQLSIITGEELSKDDINLEKRL